MTTFPAEAIVAAVDPGFSASVDLVLDDGDGNAGESESEGESDHDDGLEPSGGPLCTANCFVQLRSCLTSKDVSKHFPEYGVTQRWYTIKRTSGVRIGSTRCLMGTALKAVCSNPGHPRCFLFLPYSGNLEHCDAECLKWLIAGTGLNDEEHRLAAKQVSAHWRAVTSP